MQILHLYLEKGIGLSKNRIKHQKVVNKRLQSNNFKMQRLFNIEMSPNLYENCDDCLNLYH